MNLFKKACVASLLGWAALSTPLHAENLKLVLTGDIYELDSSAGRGGMARLATVVEAQRAAADNVLFVHAGDTFSPSLLSGFVKGKQMVELFNAMQLDLMVLGNHEWDFGPEVLRERVMEANFPVLASNVREADGLPIGGTIRTHMVNVGPYRVGFMGLVTPMTKELSTVGGMTFAPNLESARELADELRGQGADLVIALAHLDYTEDLEIVNSGIVDAVLSGHDHYKITWDNGRSVWMESGEDAEAVAVMDISMDRNEKGRFTWEASMEMIDTRHIHPDRYITGMVKQYEEFLSKELDVTIGKTSVEIDSRKSSVRGKETVIGNVIADAMRNEVQADIAIANGGGIRGNKIYTPGTTLTRRDILTELPFGNKTIKLVLTGAQVREALENGVSQAEKGAGRFPQVSGLSFTWSPKAAPGQRIRTIQVGGAPIQDGQTYTVATNDYMGSGGDGYSVFKGAQRLVDESGARLMANAVADYIQQNGGFDAELEGRIREQ